MMADDAICEVRSEKTGVGVGEGEGVGVGVEVTCRPAVLKGILRAIYGCEEVVLVDSMEQNKGVRMPVSMKGVRCPRCRE